MRAATSAETQIESWRHAEAAINAYATETLAHFRASVDSRDDTPPRRRGVRENTVTATGGWEFYSALLHSPYRPQLELSGGKIFLDIALRNS